MMTNHREQQACKDNTDQSQTIPLGSGIQTWLDSIEDILQQFKNQIQQNKTYTYHGRITREPDR